MSNQKSNETAPVAHLYAQYDWHDDAYLVANKKALESIRNTINKALENNQSEGTMLFVNDGEGYHLHVIPQEGDLSSENWIRMQLPYTDKSEGGAGESRHEGEFDRPSDLI